MYTYMYIHVVFLKQKGSAIVTFKILSFGQSWQQINIIITATSHEHYVVSVHIQIDCLFNSLRQQRKHQNSHNQPFVRGIILSIPPQRFSIAGNVTMWWHHHDHLDDAHRSRSMRFCVGKRADVAVCCQTFVVGVNWNSCPQPILTMSPRIASLAVGYRCPTANETIITVTS